ncbi:MAG: aminotransferase class V-fold PLP-dependent enzyme [Longimicrobiales bacterium]
MIPTVSSAAFDDARGREYRWTQDAIYLNAASWGPLPECSRRAGELFERQRQLGQLRDADLIHVQDQARHAVARLINAQTDEIALMPNTSSGLNLAAHLATLRATSGRRTIVLSDREFPANVYPWLALRRRGFQVRMVPTTATGIPDEDALADALALPDVVAFSYSFVQFSTGFRGDLARFGRICRDRDILFVVDAIQGLGAVPLDVQTFQIDVLACGGQKWLCSPWGTGFVYLRSDLCRTLEPYLPGWLAYSASQDFTRLTGYACELRDDAQRFELGSQPFQACGAFAESVQLLLALGVAHVYQHNLALQDRIVSWARAQGDVQIVSHPTARSGILCIRPADAVTAHGALLEAHVTCAFREGAIRLSPHFYNSAAEIERVLATLELVLAP